VRRVAIVGVASEVIPEPDGRNDAELLAPVVDRALAAAGVAPSAVGVVGSAGSEFLNGVVGTVMGAFDAMPCWPPRTHTHLDGDGAFALYEVWVRLLAGEADVGLVCAVSRPVATDPLSVLALQLDPYLVAPLGPGPRHLAALQARVMIDRGRCTESDLAEVVRARRRLRADDDLLAQPYVASPLRSLDCSTVCSGAAAVVLATEEAAYDAAVPAWVMGMEHRVETAGVGRRDLAASPSTRTCAERLGVAGSSVDVVELHAPFSHQELILLDALGARVGSLNPSGGALPADPIMATGLVRLGAAAQAILDGRAGRVVAHATNGACLQHNLLCLLERDR
jgi:acetyl-CoA acetyltransferase